MGRRRWADDLQPSLAGRGAASHALRDAAQRDHGEAHGGDDLPPVTASLFSLQRSAGNRAVSAALRSRDAGARRPIVAQRDKPTKKRKPQAPKPPAWLKDAQGILAEMAKSEPHLGNVTLRNFVDLNAALKSSEYAAWTQSGTEIYLKNPYPKGTSRGDADTRNMIEQYVRYVLRHEGEHVSQFARDGGPPKSWRQMLEYEQDAYAKDVKWLDGPGTSILTDADVLKDVKKQVTKNLKDVTDLLDGIARLPPKSDVERHLHKEMVRLKLIPYKAGLNPQDLYVQP